MFNMQSPIVNNIMVNGGVCNNTPLNYSDNFINVGDNGYNQQQFNPYMNTVQSGNGFNPYQEQTNMNQLNQSIQQPQINGFNPYQQQYQNTNQQVDEFNQYYQQQQQYQNQQPQMNGFNPYQQQYQNINYNQQSQQMGGYYNSIYDGYYNPYMAQRQQELQQIQMKEIQLQQSAIWKLLSKKVNHALGREVDDEYLSKLYDPVIIDQKEQASIDKYNHMQQLENIYRQGPMYIKTPNTVRIENNIQRFELAKKRFPDDTSLYDFLSQAGELYSDVIMSKVKKDQKQLNKLYNHNDYQQLINMHTKTESYFNKLLNNNGQSIDDMEITLPSHLNTEYQRRKQAFMNSILGGGNNG